MLNIVTTGNCNVGCTICCNYKNPFQFSHIGKTAKERTGLINLIHSIDKNKGIGYTGGDPLKNIPALKILAEEYKGDKGIVINPISFLVLELNKPGPKITYEDTKKLPKSYTQFSEKTKEIIKYLSMFDTIETSVSDLQGPSPEIVEYGKEFFNGLLKPRICKPNDARIIERDQLNKQVDDNGNIKGPEGLQLVGRLRQDIENERLKSPYMTNPQRHHPMKVGCKSMIGNYSDTWYFKKENNANQLYFALCCWQNGTPYNSWKTSLSLENMSEMNPETIAKEIENEQEKFENSNQYNLLNSAGLFKQILSWYDLKKKGMTITEATNKEYDLKAKSHYEQFEFYFEKTKELICKKTGQKPNLLKNTYILGRDFATTCDLCNTAGVLLARAGITTQEFQSYLDKEIEKEIKKKK